MMGYSEAGAAAAAAKPLDCGASPIAISQASRSCLEGVGS